MLRSGSVRPLWALVLAAAAFALLLVHPASPVRAAEFSDAQKAEMETVIRNYLLKNPEVLQEAMTELDRRQKAEETAHRQQVVDQKSADLFRSSNGAEIGNPQGRVTLVEFFDYNCAYCKRALDDVSKLLKSEPELRLVLKDFPVLGPGSIEAAEVAGAARNQLKGEAFWQFHYKLLATHGPIGKAQALAVAKDSGVDMDQLAKDLSGQQVRNGIQQTMQLADALGLTGTPSFVIGRDVVVGAVGYDVLKDRIDNVLKCGKAMCS